MRLALILAAGFVLAAPAAFAHAMPDTACSPGAETPLPAELAAWAAKTPLAAATSVADLPKAALVPGQAYAAALAATPDVAYAVQPEKPGRHGQQGRDVLAEDRDGRILRDRPGDRAVRDRPEVLVAEG